MRLAPRIRYRKMDGGVYLRSISARKDYLFNEIVYDVLNLVRERKECSTRELCDSLLELYDVDAEEDFRRDIADFVEMLAREKILLEDGAKEGAPGQSVMAMLEERCRSGRLLLSACLELTYRCNERCIHCYVDDAPREGELTLEEYKALLDTLWDMGCVQLLLTGGEVCQRDDFIEIARYASSLGMLVDIFTNGTALDDETFDAIAGLEPNSLSFSLYAGDARTHDAVTGVKGSFERTLRAIMTTKCAGIDTYIKTVVMRENLEGLEGLLKLGKRIGVPVAPAFSVLDTHGGGSGACHRLNDVKQYQAAMELTDRYQPAQEPRRRGEPGDAICNAGLCSLSIDPYGEVYPCLSMRMSLGNIREHDLRDIWDHSMQLRELRKLRMRDVCKNFDGCDDRNQCEICLGGVLYNDFADIQIPREFCMISEARGNLIRNQNGTEGR